MDVCDPSEYPSGTPLPKVVSGKGHRKEGMESVCAWDTLDSAMTEASFLLITHGTVP